MHWAGRGGVLAVTLALLASAVGATPIALVDGRAAAFVGEAQQGPLDAPVSVASYAGFAAIFGAGTDGLANPYLAPSVAAFFVNGGTHAVVVRVAGDDDASVIGSDGGPGQRTGLQALRDGDAAAFVAVPGVTSAAVQAAMVALCTEMGDRLAILDPASTTDPSAVVAQRAGLVTDTGFATLYFPWVLAVPAGSSLLLPPSGFVAGVMARTAPPEAPVGAVTSATAVSYDVSTLELEQLTPLGINTIRDIPGQGIRVWGARTLASDPEWRYVSVRRTALTIGHSVLAGTAWCLQEPNDAALWLHLRSDVEDFLYALFVAGWFQGATPSQAYFVQCGLETMTQQDILEGRTIILMGFAPIAPAEFVLVRVVQQRDDSVSVPATPALPRLDGPWPNPFNPQTDVACDLPREAALTVAVYDVAGRLVRTLAAGRVEAAGRHTLRWDGTDAGGRALPGGVYLVRMRADGVVVTRRAMLVR